MVAGVQVMAAGTTPTVSQETVDTFKADLDRLLGRLPDRVATARANLTAGSINAVTFAQSTMKFANQIGAQIAQRWTGLPFGR